MIFSDSESESECPDTFSGNQTEGTFLIFELRGWLKSMNKYLVECNVPEEKKVYNTIYGGYLTGYANSWGYEYIRNIPDVTWERFATDITNHFFTFTEYFKVIREFNELKQKGSVNAYIVRYSEFLDILTTRDEYPNLFLIYKFLNGLDSRICSAILNRGIPLTLEVAYEQAKFENSNKGNRRFRHNNNKKKHKNKDKNKDMNKNRINNIGTING